MKSGFRIGSGAAALAAMMTTGLAQAETISVEGYLPASSDAGIELEVIAVDPLDGNQGGKLGFELKKVLERAGVDNNRWFDVAPGRNTPVDAVIQGSADSQSSITQLEDKEVRSCEKKNEDKKCILYKTTYYDCNRFEVSLYPDIELVGRDGEVLYYERDELSRTEDHCDDSGSRPSRSEMTNGLVRSFANRVRRALAPRTYRQDYRILERRKGLEKADRNAFKAAVKLTKSNEDAACEAFKAIELHAPDHASVLFNVALCYERFGDYDMARETYQRALNASPDKPMTLEAFDRVDSWERGRNQVAMRAEIIAARYAEPADAAEAPAE
ncbi:tetratricopeptide repeat protein [Erythrobacter sp. F6033]|uniref:tetratricopeptide repeat protein n=1 Tax=Erythrobacter sp. F6033 TaxID=2926401 RepID=UPI001FF1E60F|nr:tetratricopeptide repeat protein [Erythrobacter sp. F6033]MCK0128663.1 tetratricopeptide repeat protein [Erythrobacter sp. F6033]